MEIYLDDVKYAQNKCIAICMSEKELSNVQVDMRIHLSISEAAELINKILDRIKVLKGLE